MRSEIQLEDRQRAGAVGSGRQGFEQGLHPSVGQRLEPFVGLSSPAAAEVLEGRSCYFRQV